MFVNIVPTSSADTKQNTRLLQYFERTTTNLFDQGFESADQKYQRAEDSIDIYSRIFLDRGAASGADTRPGKVATDKLKPAHSVPRESDCSRAGHLQVRILSSRHLGHQEDAPLLCSCEQTEASSVTRRNVLGE